MILTLTIDNELAETLKELSAKSGTSVDVLSLEFLKDSAECALDDPELIGLPHDEPSKS
jgi:hypothetical protein